MHEPTEAQIGEAAEEAYLYDGITIGQLTDRQGCQAQVSEVLELALGTDPAAWAALLKAEDPSLYEQARSLAAEAQCKDPGQLDLEAEGVSER